MENFHTNWSKRELNRYGRHLILEEFGSDAQARVCESKVLVVGAGGLGCPVLLYLAGSGVKVIGICDYDVVEVSNLHRQVLYSEKECGRLKVEVAKERLQALNSSLQVRCHPQGFTAENALEMLEEYDLCLDCTDRGSTRYLINDACVLAKTPLLSASCVKFQGQVMLWGDGGPCLRCVYPNPLPASKVEMCSNAGVFGPVPGMLGTIQATEALKFLSKVSKSSDRRKMLLVNAARMEFRSMVLPGRNPNCQICSSNPSIINLDPETYRRLDTCCKPQLEDSKWEVSWEEFEAISKRSSEKLSSYLLDVRSKTQNKICGFKGATNIPLKELQKDDSLIQEVMKPKKSAPIYVMCRRGIFSVIATNHLRRQGFNAFNINGGISTLNNGSAY